MKIPDLKNRRWMERAQNMQQFTKNNDIWQIFRGVMAIYSQNTLRPSILATRNGGELVTTKEAGKTSKNAL